MKFLVERKKSKVERLFDRQFEGLFAREPRALRQVMGLLLLSLFIFQFSPLQANDYLEKEKHYNVYASGVNKVHFVIPVWAYGKSYDYYAYDDSYVSYTVNGESETRIAWYKTDKYDENEKDSKKGTAYMYLLDGQGDIIVTSMASGVDKQVPSGRWSDKLIVTQKEDDDCPQVTMLEFDWYLPLSLEKKTFTVKIVSKFRRSYTDGNAMTTTVTSSSSITGTETIITPQLYTPYLYTLNEKGVAGYGYAAVPYMVFQDPEKYHTSFAPNTVIDKNVERSGTIYVPTNDTVQEQLSATFTVIRNAKTGDKAEVQSTAVDIPPYHRIYNFEAVEETDSTGTFTGNNVLTWNIKNPALKDLMDNDYFEVQRALSSDFSDAERVKIVQMTREGTGQYSLIDNNRNTWTGNADSINGTYHLTTRDTKFVVLDPAYNTIAEIDATLHSRNTNIPGVPVYYRIRRASSSMWDWDIDFTKTATMFKQNFLAPLAETQEAYTIDADYANNHKVNFRFKIENKRPATTTIDKSKCDLTYSINRVLREQNVNVTFSYKAVNQYYDDGANWNYWYRNPADHTYCRILDDDGKVYADWQKYSSDETYHFPINYTMEVKLDNSYDGARGGDNIHSFVLKSNCKIESNFSTAMGDDYDDILYWTAKINYYENPIVELIDLVKQDIIDSLYNVMQQEYSITNGRSMWDRTAQLILQRTIEETGQTMEFIIPQDSIRRQADGSWIATYSDIADQGCSHYKYAVRIDQSRSDLHVQDSASLKPIQITGPSLYFDEAATITRFEASQGDATTAMKPGVLLRWETNSTAVDEFTLLRKMTGSDATPDTVYRGTNYDYFDRSAVPNQHYEYTIVASYSCNGKTTTNSKSAEGWRTPYGEISGTIHQSDNSGMAGVIVNLQDSSGNIVRSMQTDASGAYKFDSLEYGIETIKTYTYEDLLTVVDSVYTCDDPKVTFTYAGDLNNYTVNVHIRIKNPDGVVLQDWRNSVTGTYTYPLGSFIEVKFAAPDGSAPSMFQSGYPNIGQVYSFTLDKDITLQSSLKQENGKSYFDPAITASSEINCKYVPIKEFIHTKVDSTVTIRSISATDYAVVPTHQYGVFSFNNTSAGTASITLSQYNAVASGIDFANTASVRLTGRVLYKQSTIPVSGAMFLLNGDTVRRGSEPLKSGIDGNFELLITKGQKQKLQVFKPGHSFEGNGILRVESGEEEFALDKALDGVRFYDETKVRLVGRVAGGNDQRDLPRGFGLGKNNLGDNLQLVLQLEGDNTAHFVHDPNDLTLDTIHEVVPHLVYWGADGSSATDSADEPSASQVGRTAVTFEKKRIIVNPDPKTGEFAVDLFPVKYKVVQATATGYATLFANGQGSETFDLTEAPLVQYTGKYDATNLEIEVKQSGLSGLSGSSGKTTISRSNTLRDGDSIAYNAVYDRIYHSPVVVSLTQVLYGMEKDGFGEEEIEVSSMNLTHKPKVKLYTKAQGEPVNYLLGHPVFIADRKYQFIARAYERYYYNNDSQAGTLDEVPQRGGKVRVHNGLKSATTYLDYGLDNKGENRTVALDVTDIDTESSGTAALRTVSTALEVEGNWVETDVFQAFVSGTDVQNGDLMQTDAAVVLLDVVRDPGGAGSSAWVESGTTYNFSYTESYDWEIGVELTPQYGVDISQDIGAIAAPQGAGSYIGSTYESSRQLSMTIPITHEWKWGYKYNYQFTTNERIATSSSSAKAGVGSNADVFLGTTISQLAGKAKTVSIISDSMYTARQPAIDAGVMKVLGSGTASDGRQYYLVTGQQTVLGSRVGNTFVYTQEYVLNTLIPKLALERKNLLMDFPDSITAQQYANTNGIVVYWNKSATATKDTEGMKDGTYRMIKPVGKDIVENDRIAALNNMIADWVKIVYLNEKEKVMAATSGKPVGTWSVSAGASFSHTDNYNATAAYNEMPQTGMLFGMETASNATKTGQKLLSDMQGIVNFFKTMGSDQIGTSVAEALNQMADQNDADVTNRANQQALGTKTNTSSFSLKYNPVFSFDSNDNNTTEKTVKKSAGFSLGADAHGDITVSVYRADLDSVWEKNTKTVVENIPSDIVDDYKFGSYVFYTMAGSSYCPHEDAEKTNFYNAGTALGNETQWIHKPELSIDTHEQTAVMADKRATFRVTMMDAGQVQTGVAMAGTLFELSLVGSSNPEGAKVYMDGAPLITSVPVWLAPGQAATKVMEVERGLVDDYDKLQLMLSLADCPKTNTTLDFSVHFLPVSSDVTIAMPRQNWIMNTLSQHDSAGYYLPVEIDGFDIHHKNFDHIEFQYKLSTESEEMWVNQCSFYASDSLYDLATGNKAMIRNGRIEPFRFYGERDPMEQHYDLRAVSFCRYGSGFVTKSSPVISGTKDTRPPRVFGDPEPANAILGVGDQLLLRFNEPIAGNYLDEDNNFQLKGVTNATGITTKASVHFDGTQDSYATSQVSRNLEGKSVTIDMLVKPTSPNAAAVFFSHGEGDEQVRFGKTADNRLYISNSEGAIYSKQAETMLDFTRVIATYDALSNTIQFYAGTTNLTDGTGALPQDLASYYKTSAPLVFGRGLDGNMLEVRLWTKALTQEEIAATHLHYLTGYEQELVAYYPMTEGQGTTLSDKAGGATLLMHGATWNLPKGISLHINNGEDVQLNGNLLGRSKVYDETLMLWFRPVSASGDVFKAGWTNRDAGGSPATDSADEPSAPQAGTLLAIENGTLVLHSDGNQWSLGAVRLSDWNHFVLTVNRTYNNVSAFVNGKMTATFAATELAGIQGAMYFGGNGFEGNIDEFVIFEQALPKVLVEEYGNHSPAGDEMGLMAYLPFEEQILNQNGILELVFSVNDQREFRDASGNVIEKVVPLIIGRDAGGSPATDSADEPSASRFADKAVYAPVTGSTLLSKLNFDWAFNQDELLINLKMQDREINKQAVIVTVRDVEDLNGNPMPSPVMWVAYVDRNSVTWDNNKMEIYVDYGAEYYNNYRDIRIVNNSGKRHQFTIESLPDWLTVSQSFGTIQPIDDYTVRFTYNTTLPVGTYTDMVYVTDENGLSEPLKVIMYVEARCPWDEPDNTKYALNMSVCGQVIIDGVYDTDSNDKVIALYRNECVGMANVAFSNLTNKSEVYLTVYGNETMVSKNITFQLWQASTGKVLNLIPSNQIRFAHGNVFGCGSDAPVIFTAGGNEVQNIQLQQGWNWTSFNIYVQADNTGVINNVMTAADPWTEGDLIKNPVTRNFCVYSDSLERFAGSLYHFRYVYSHMIYCQNGNTMRVSGGKIPADSMRVTLRGGGQWSPLPCLYSQAMPITEALADYFDNATPGDLLKSHDRFAVFSQDKRWVGDLTAIRPGEGYFFRRMGQGDVVMHYYNKASSAAPKKVRNKSDYSEYSDYSDYHNPNAATNMTMIAKVVNVSKRSQVESLRAYVGDELAGIATPQVIGSDTLYFLTIQSDNQGELHFEMNGQTLSIVSESHSDNQIRYAANAHHGSLKAPVLLIPAGDTLAYPQKRIIDGILYIFSTDGRVYDAQGKLVDNPLK